MPFFYYFDPYYWVILVPAMLIALAAQIQVSSTFNRYSKVRSARGMTGAQAAEAVLRANGVSGVAIERVNGRLTDHYDPTKKVLALSGEVYNGTSLAALGVAAHEAGHAIQHKCQYAPLNLRMALVPITNFACSLLPIVMLGGFFLFHSPMLIYAGVAIYLVLTVFQLVTLPVEFNASTRAKAALRELGIIEGGEARGVEDVLDAAAFTYVAAFISSLGWLLYLFAASNNRD